MKKYILILFALSLFLLPSQVSAQDIGAGFVKKAATEAGYSPKTTEVSFATTLGAVVNLVLQFVGVIFLILMIYAGYLWMTARGDDTQIEKARNIIKSAIIGLVLTISAFSITNYVVPIILSRTAG